jgi:hypothetical protein
LTEIYYVYIHVDPITQEIVYIGKGVGGRAWDVTRARGEHKEHQQWMKDLMENGFIPSDWVRIERRQLTEKEALKFETELRHSIGITKFNRQSGERQHRSKMTNEQALKAFELVKEGKTHKEIAEMYGVSRTAISMLLTGKQWRAVTAGVRIETTE